MPRLFLLFVAIVGLAPGLALADSGVTLSSADGEYQLVVPAGWKSADFHLDNVQIGAENEKKGEYVEIVAEDQKDYTNSLARYAEAKRDTMAMSLDNPKMDAGERLKINGLDAVRCAIHGQLPNSDISIGYLLTVMKTKTHYIQIIAWTKESLFADKKADLAGLAEGFSETSGDKS